MLPPASSIPTNTPDCICFGSDVVNKTLPEKCQMLYVQALQVKANYDLLLIGIGGLIILFIIIIILLYLNLRKTSKPDLVSTDKSALKSGLAGGRQNG